MYTDMGRDTKESDTGSVASADIEVESDDGEARGGSTTDAAGRSAPDLGVDGRWT